MPLTKEEISDLRSAQERVVQCELAKQNADATLEKARSILEGILWKLEHPDKK